MAERIYTQQELEEFYKAGPELNALGLIMIPENSPEAIHNIERIGAFFDLNAHVPVTVQAILAAVEQMRPQMRWKSVAQQAFDKLAAQLPDQGRDLLSWIPRQRTSGPADPGNIYGSKPSDYRT